MAPVRRVQSLRDARERRAFVADLPLVECVVRLERVTWIEQGEHVALGWPPPPGKVVFGWVTDEGFMLSPVREHERLSLNLAWGGWAERDGLTIGVVDLLSLKSSRPLLLLLPVVGLVGYLGFSLLAGRLLLSTPATLAIAAIVATLVGVIAAVDEWRARADHRDLFALLLDMCEGIEAPGWPLEDAPPLPPAPARPEPPRPVPWRR